MFPLPHELWVSIFYLATYNTIRDTDYLINPPPLAIFCEKKDDELNDAALKTKHSLSLVCSLWRKLVLPFMFEDIKIRHGSEALELVLERGTQSTPNHGLGHLVRRVQLSLIPNAEFEKLDTTWSNAIGGRTCRILQACKNVVHLERRRLLLCHATSGTSLLEPGSAQDLHDSERLHLPKLARVDWHRGNRRYPNYLGVDCIPAFILESPSVRFLSLLGTTWEIHGNGVFKAVETFYGLSSEGTTSGSHPSDPQYQLPSLSRVIIHHPCSFLLPPIAENLHRLRILEIDRHLKFFRPCLARIISVMPNLEELYYPLFFVRWRYPEIIDPLNHLYPRHPNLILVGMHAAHNGALQVEDITKWIIDEHITPLCDASFPSLRTIRLCGQEWASILTTRGFQDVRLALSGQVELTSDDAQTARSLSVPL